MRNNLPLNLNVKPQYVDEIFLKRTEVCCKQNSEISALKGYIKLYIA